MVRSFALLVLGVSLRALAADTCDQPRPRDIAPLMQAIAQDDALAASFDATATACVSDSAVCDAAKLQCGNLLTTTLQKQVNVDDGMWLRDMLIPFQGQRYALIAQIPMNAVAQDVSCNADSASLKAAASRRRQLAQKRRDIVNEYPKWAQWAGGISQQCKVGLAAQNKAASDAAAAAQVSAASALAAKQAEELRQAEIMRQSQLAAQKAEADRRARDEQARQLSEQQKLQRAADLEKQRQQNDAQKTLIEMQADAARRKQEEDARRQADAQALAAASEEKKRQEAALAADSKFVSDREAKKAAAEKKAEDLRMQEEARRVAAEKQIMEAGGVDRSDERLKGSIALQLVGAYAQFVNPNSGGMLGGLLTLRYGLWLTAPANGMASGMELKVNAMLLGQFVGSGGAILFNVTPELRWYFSRFGVGATFDWRHLSTHGNTTDPLDTFSVGPNISLALFDDPNGRIIATLRYLPFVFSGLDWARVTGELEMAFKYFSSSIQGGTLTMHSGGVTTTGWFVGLGLGGRLRF